MSDQKLEPFDLEELSEHPHLTDSMRDSIERMLRHDVRPIYADDEYIVYRSVREGSVWVMGEDPSQPAGVWNHRVEDPPPSVFWTDLNKKMVRRQLGLEGGWQRVVGDPRTHKLLDRSKFRRQLRKQSKRAELDDFLDWRLGGIRGRMSNIHGELSDDQTLLGLIGHFMIYAGVVSAAFLSYADTIGAVVLLVAVGHTVLGLLSGFELIETNVRGLLYTLVSTAAGAEYYLRGGHKAWKHTYEYELEQHHTEMGETSATIGSHTIVFDNAAKFQRADTWSESGSRITREDYVFLIDGMVAFLHDEHEPVKMEMSGLYEFDLMPRHGSQTHRRSSAPDPTSVEDVTSVRTLRSA